MLASLVLKEMNGVISTEPAFTVAAGPYSDYIRTKTLEDGMDN